MSYLCPECGGTKKRCRLCKGKGKVSEQVIIDHSRRPKREIRRAKPER